MIVSTTFVGGLVSTLGGARLLTLCVGDVCTTLVGVSGLFRLPLNKVANFLRAAK